MIIKRIENVTRIVGGSQGYASLPLRDELYHDSVTGPGAPSMVSAWELTPDELARVNNGALIYLHVTGTIHPPVYLEVGKVPE